jgi:hypothetical protein
MNVQYQIQGALVFAISSTKISVAPTSVSLSITVAMLFLSTMELTATHPSSSRALIVGARRPGVTLVARCSEERSTLYWQRTYFWAAGKDVLGWEMRVGVWMGNREVERTEGKDKGKGGRRKWVRERGLTDNAFYARGDEVDHCGV